jgi:hypothetical protein
MNEKIKLLAEQAKIDYDLRPEIARAPIWIGTDEELEKFAELIVRECIDITDELVNRNADGTWTSNELYTDYNGALSEVKRRIEQHFGVEDGDV